MLDLLRVELSKKLSALPKEAGRLFHGRGHCYKGLEFINIDWFKPVIWVVLYGDVADDVVAAISELIVSLVKDNAEVTAVALQSRQSGRAHQQVIYGELPEKCYAYENTMRYELNLSQNQNIGFFLDAQPAREWVRKNAAGKNVLNLFAYTCSFSVAAMQGGANSVVNIDMAKSAIATGQRNHALNAIDSSKVRFLAHDIFRSTRKLQDLGPYDIVIVDPPSRQKGSFEAEKDYVRLLKKLAPMLAENAVIVACLNAPYLGDDFLVETVAQGLPEYHLIERLPQREDFPEKELNCALKMQLFAK
jgi:23S rRNA (cytosine1962-C5)-methyltransferase